MGLFNSVCSVNAKDFQTLLKDLEAVNNKIQRITSEIERPAGSIKSRFTPLPEEMKTIKEARTSAADTDQENAVTRYNSFVNFYNQIDEDSKNRYLSRNLKDLFLFRNNLTEALARLC